MGADNSLLRVKKVLHWIVKLFHKWSERKWGLVSSILACKTLVSVGGNVVLFVIVPGMKDLWYIYIVAVVWLIGNFRNISCLVVDSVVYTFDVAHPVDKSQIKMKIKPSRNLQNHYTFLGICPPTPPLSQHFALSEKCWCWLRGGVGGHRPDWACLGARVAQWLEHSPPTNVAQVQILVSTRYVG